MKRAVVLSLKHITQTKHNKLQTLINHYRHAVNFYLQSFEQEEGKLNKLTLAKLQNTKLSERYKSNALKQALGIYAGCKKTKKKTPYFKGFPILDAKFVTIETGQCSFDLVIKISSLIKGKRLLLPTHKTKVLNKWLSKGTLIQGCEIHPGKAIVWVEINEPKYQSKYKTGKTLGIDLGMIKMITTSDGEFLGQEIGKYINKINNKQKNSKAYKRALKARDNYVNKIVNELPWSELSVLCYENLINMTKGKKGFRRYKKFRIKQQHWTIRKVVTRILEKCQENRVRPVCVNPRNTSRTCPNCNNVAEANRKLEVFCCLTCGYKQDADLVGATNILRIGCDWLRSVESLNPQGLTC